MYNLFQVSGLKLVYRIRNGNAGNRIESIKTRCDQSPDEWCDLDTNRNYTVALISFLAEGIYERNILFGSCCGLITVSSTFFVKVKYFLLLLFLVKMIY